MRWLHRTGKRYRVIECVQQSQRDSRGGTLSATYDRRTGRGCRNRERQFGRCGIKLDNHRVVITGGYQIRQLVTVKIPSHNAQETEGLVVDNEFPSSGELPLAVSVENWVCIIRR